MSQITETLHIEGMSCNHCVSSVTRALSETDGVLVDSVAIGTARVTFDPAKTPRSKLVEAIEDIGFEVKS
jgi:copper chaperone